MMFSFQEKNNNKNELSVHEKIGFAVRCMLYNRNYSLYPVLTIQIWTEFAINHDQIKFLFDGKGMPLAYITWAYIAPDTEERLISDPEFRLHPSEWNEGGRIWVLDFCCKPGFGAKAIEHFSKFPPWGEGEVRWLSRKKKIMKLR
ncbi:toxin-activating lysine-acyltransferase [Salmonella enterica]|uniref:RTX toxin-activating lysine-acyltransferase n=4 Tax=Salmonella enterica TaxID=28901 RepID=A0A619I1F7_SALER|nr:toxin-activating lysine-acyltransferase [Salmonella enterica]EDE6687470.1 toxin-activating lysine-acyltransferase [Salmonella enterica subsp. enterica serovar Apeyeme]EDQ9996517.1 toxin-activating lysine-acyltransferase [Salmonella enterica subsp. enterica serovar Java]EDV3184553.1 toxin-activating lysine-acyltransferase [Salmonella enterica subsp. diarizonae]EDX3987660.1 toxin-activating lysine-acyltransferase [Salmonella enterica subsp. enterica serovar 4,[5],12:b:-]EEP4266514.1 toxin-act